MGQRAPQPPRRLCSADRVQLKITDGTQTSKLYSADDKRHPIKQLERWDHQEGLHGVARGGVGLLGSVVVVVNMLDTDTGKLPAARMRLHISPSALEVTFQKIQVVGLWNPRDKEPTGNVQCLFRSNSRKYQSKVNMFNEDKDFDYWCAQKGSIGSFIKQLTIYLLNIQLINQVMTSFII